MSDRKWRKAMLSAIDRCRSSLVMKTVSRANGLRCVRQFEAINGIAFDPFNGAHVDTVAGMGPFCAMFRKFEIMRARGEL